MLEPFHIQALSDAFSVDRLLKTLLQKETLLIIGNFPFSKMFLTPLNYTTFIYRGFS